MLIWLFHFNLQPGMIFLNKKSYAYFISISPKMPSSIVNQQMCKFTQKFKSPIYIEKH